VAIAGVLVVTGALLAACTSGSTSSSGAFRGGIGPAYYYVGSLPSSLQRVLTVPATLQETEVFQCDHLTSVPSVSHTIGEARCKYYGDAHGLVVADYHWAGKKAPIGTVATDLVTSLEAGGWQVTDSREFKYKYTIRGHGWKGVALLYRNTTGSSTPSAVVLVTATIALSPSPAHT
jgi:hypothetical protein